MASSAKLPYQMPVNGIFHFPRSDGSPAKRPTYTKENAPEGVYNYLEVVPHDDERNKRWRKEVATHLMTLLGLRPNSLIQYRLASFPEHYVLYAKPRLEEVSGPRDDLHLYGSRYVTNFRSPREFVYHAHWLFTDPNMDNANCECKWCTGTPQKELTARLGVKVDHYGSGTTKDPAMRVTPESEDDIPASPIESRPEAEGQRAQNSLQENPPYRIGELVWAHVRPPIKGQGAVQTIDCWPALIVETVVRILQNPPDMVPRVDRKPGFKIRLLGTTHVATLEGSDLLPFNAYRIPQGLHEALATLRPLVDMTDPSAIDKLRNVALYADSVFDHSVRTLTFEQVWPAFCMGIIMTFRIPDFWSVTASPPHAEDPSPNLRPLPEIDGLWWGAERIWVGDLVRLRMGRHNTGSAHDEHEEPLLSLLTDGAETRGVFMKIDAIRSRLPLDKIKAPADVWLVGTPYETVPAGHGQEIAAYEDHKMEPRSAVDGSSLADLTPLILLPDPPTGFRFHAIMSPGSTITVTAGQLAGRYYPHLLFSPVFSTIRSRNAVREEQLISLCGYAAGEIWPAAPPRGYVERSETLRRLEGEVYKFVRRQWTKSGPQIKAEPT